MDNNLHSIFVGPFYINKEYAQSLVPVLYSVLIQNNSSKETEEDKTKSVVTLSNVYNAVSESNQTATDVVIISIKQPILKYSNYEFLGSKSFISILDYYKNLPNIAGVVLDIDSGGGQVYGTPEFYDYLLSYPKPVVTFTDGYLCSAAYYIANATNCIIAHKRANSIGSIGGYTTVADFTGFWEKYGAKIHTIYGTESTEKNSEYREILLGNYEPYLKNCLDPMIATFHADMLSTRPNLDQSVFKGGTWDAEKALSLGLIDEIGTIKTAIEKVISLSNINSNSNTMQTKQLPKIQAVLGLNAPLASTDNGSFLNAEQLDLLEGHYATLESSKETLQTQLTEAQNNTELQEKLTTATSTITTIGTAVDAMITEAGVTVNEGATLTEKLTSLSAKVTEMSGKDASKTTSVIIEEENQNGISNNVVGGIDVSAALNN